MSEHPTTTNHNFARPEEGSLEGQWGPIINQELIDLLEQRVAIRGPDANRSNFTPNSEAVYISDDTGDIHTGDGSSWNYLGSLVDPSNYAASDHDHSGETINPDTVNAGSATVTNELDINGSLQQDTANSEIAPSDISFGPAFLDRSIARGWRNNWFYRAAEIRGSTISSTPNPDTGVIDDLTVPDRVCIWDNIGSVSNGEVILTADSMPSQIYAVMLNTPSGTAMEANSAELEFLIDGTWTSMGVVTDGRPYIWTGFYENGASELRITFSNFEAGGGHDQFRLSGLTLYTQGNASTGAYLTREGGEMYGDITQDGQPMVTMGPPTDLSLTSGDTVGETIRADDGTNTPSGHAELCLWVNDSGVEKWQIIGTETYIEVT